MVPKNALKSKFRILALDFFQTPTKTIFTFMSDIESVCTIKCQIVINEINAVTMQHVDKKELIELYTQGDCNMADFVLMSMVCPISGGHLEKQETIVVDMFAELQNSETMIGQFQDVCSRTGHFTVCKHLKL